MQNVLIVAPDWSDECDIVSTSENPEFPVGNLLTDQPGEEFRSASGSFQITLDRQTDGKPLNVIALIDTNAASAYGATWQVKMCVDTGFTTGYDSGTLGMRASPWITSLTRRHSLLIPYSAPVWNFGEDGWKLGGGLMGSYRYMQITIANVPESYFSAGRLIVGQGYKATINYSYGGSPFGITDPTNIVESPSGQRYPRVGGYKPRTVKFTLSNVDQTEAWNNLPAIMEYAAGSRPVLVVFDYEESVHLERMMIYGTLSTRQSMTNPAFDLYEQTFELTEMV